MRRFVFLVVIVVSLGLVVPVWGGGYTEKTRTDMEQVIQHFFNAERGNRLTSFSVQGLWSKINETFDRNRKTEDGGRKTEDGRKEGWENIPNTGR